MSAADDEPAAAPLPRPLYLVAGRVVPPGRLVRTARGWVLPAPARCPRCGNPFGPGRVLVGWTPCRGQDCDTGTERTGHRVDECRACAYVVYTPPEDGDCPARGHRPGLRTPVGLAPPDHRARQR